MKFESTFDLGETCWCTINNSKVIALTIGLIRIEEVCSLGIENSLFDNYKPKISYKEEYMCTATGIGSGHIYTPGYNIFKTQKEALDAVEEFKKGD